MAMIDCLLYRLGIHSLPISNRSEIVNIVCMLGKYERDLDNKNQYHCLTVHIPAKPFLSNHHFGLIVDLNPIHAGVSNNARETAAHRIL